MTAVDESFEKNLAEANKWLRQQRREIVANRVRAWCGCSDQPTHLILDVTTFVDQQATEYASATIAAHGFHHGFRLTVSAVEQTGPR